MNILSCKDISKTYITDLIFENVSFQVNSSDKIGLIGLNGSGKTTLFNILSGKIKNDDGELYIRKNIRIGYLQQHVNISDEKSIFESCLEVFKDLIQMEEDLRSLEVEISNQAENNNNKNLDELMEKYGTLLEKFNELNGYGYKSEIRGVLTGLGFKESDFNKSINILSGGQKSRVELAKLLLEQHDLLLLDEPTNHLDINAINWLEGYLSDYDGAMIIISHDRYFLDRVVGKIFHMDNKTLKVYNSDYTLFMKQRKKDLEVLKKQYENQQKEIKRQEEIIERFANYGDARYIKQAQSRQKLLDQMKKIPPPSENKSSKISFHPNIETGFDVLSVENVNKSFGDLHLLKDVSLNIYKGDKVGLIGPNGVGKTTLFKIILGKIEKDSGEIKLGSNVVAGYFEQEMESLNPENTVIDEVWDSFPKLTYHEVRTILSQFLFIGDDILKEIKDLSGGEKGRVSLLKLMLSKANFLLMDEPTNHLDIDSKEILEEALNEYTGTLLVISHDRYFLNKTTNRILELTEDNVIEYLGNYDYYLSKKEELLNKNNIDEDEYKTKTQIQYEKKKERENLKEQKEKRKEIAKLEKLINEYEESLESIDKQLYDPEVYEDHEKVLELNQNREIIEGKLEKIYNKWIKLTDN